jgi:hypothetical protein
MPVRLPGAREGSGPGPWPQGQFEVSKSVSMSKAPGGEQEAPRLPQVYTGQDPNQKRPSRWGSQHIFLCLQRYPHSRHSTGKTSLRPFHRGWLRLNHSTYLDSRWATLSWTVYPPKSVLPEVRQVRVTCQQPLGKVSHPCVSHRPEGCACVHPTGALLGKHCSRKRWANTGGTVSQDTFCCLQKEAKP